MTDKDFIEERIKLIDETIKQKKCLINDRSDNEGVKRLLEQKKQLESIKKDLEMVELLKEWLVYDEREEAVMTYTDIPLDIKEKIMRWLDDRT